MGEIVIISGTRRDRVGPNKIILETINKNFNILNLIKDMTFYTTITGSASTTVLIQQYV